MRIIWAVILVLIAPHTAAAMDCADQTQLGLHKCADADFQRADKALNDAYREVLGRLAGDEHKKQLLRAAEQAWVAFRDAECKFAVSATENGSIYPMENSHLPRGSDAPADQGDRRLPALRGGRPQLSGPRRLRRCRRGATPG